MVEDLLETVDTAKLLAASACMQMNLDNVNELLILDRLALSAFRQVTAPGRDLSSSVVRRLLTADEIGGPAVLQQLDPFEGFPVGRLNYPPRQFLVLEGMATDSVLIASRILRAVFAETTANLPTDFARRVHSAGTFLLGLSDTMCRRFGRSAADSPPAVSHKVTVPSAATLATQREHVVFGPNELFAGRSRAEAEFLARTFIARHGGAHLGTPGKDSPSPGQTRPDRPEGNGFTYPWETSGPGIDGFLDDSSLILTPLVATHLGVVLVSPTSLAATFRHFVFSEAVRQGCMNELVAALTATGIDEVTFLLETVTDSPFERVDPHAPSRPYAQRLQPDVQASTQQPEIVRLCAPFDDDKILDVRLAVDSMQHYDTSSAWGYAYPPAFNVPPLAHPSERVLTIDCYLGLGRDHLYLGEERPGPGLFVPLNDLETILFAPGVERMTLWYFAMAWQRLLTDTEVQSFSVIDTFSIFHDHNQSFYLSDGPLPNYIAVEVGSGQELREAAASARGPAFQIFDQGVSRALGLHGQSSPISMLLAAPAVCFMHIDNETIWTRAEFDQGATPPHLHPDSHPENRLAEATAYWLWQLQEQEPTLLEAAEGIEHLLMDIHASWDEVDGQGPDRAPRAQHLPGPTDSTTVTGVPMKSLNIAVTVPTKPDEAAPPNIFDRQLVRALIDALAATAQDQSVWTEDRCAALLESVAPPGRKTMLTQRSQDGNPVVWPGSLPQARQVSSAVTGQILDQLGEHLRSSGFSSGPIPAEKRLEVLNDHVAAFMLDELTSTVALLDGSHAIGRFMTQYEALVHEITDERLQLPETIACFGLDSSRVRELTVATRKATTTSISIRFLIELISANPPTGRETLNTERLDRLIALAAEAVNKGQLSDALRFGLADHTLSILDSGRLGISRDAFDYSNALDMFREGLGRTEIEEATRLATHLPLPDNEQQPSRSAAPDFEALDRLAEAEYGFSYRALTDTCGHLIDLSREAGQDDIGELGLSDAVHAVAERSRQTRDEISKIISALSLNKMDDFWAAGGDVYPWTFNRARSYLRQPLIVWEQGDGEAVLLFGHRNLWMTPQHWLERHLTGRLKATSSEMKKAMASARDANGSAFEREVEQAALSAGAAITRRRFKKAGALNLANVNGADLGDVDLVFVASDGTIVLVEAKSLQVARTPRELANEMNNLVVGKKSAAARIQGRAAAVADHLAEVERELGLEHRPNRTIVAVVVTDAPLLGTLLNKSSIAIIDLSELPKLVASFDGKRPRKRQGTTQTPDTTARTMSSRID